MTRARLVSIQQLDLLCATTMAGVERRVQNVRECAMVARRQREIQWAERWANRVVERGGVALWDMASVLWSIPGDDRAASSGLEGGSVRQ